MNNQRRLTPGQRIALAGVIIAAIGIIVPVILHFMPRRGLTDEDIARIIAEAMQNLDKRTADSLAANPQQKNSLEEDLAGAIRRVYAVKQTDQGPEANAAIDQLRKSGDLSQLQAFLTEERDRHTDDDQESRLQRDREIAAVAFLRGDTNGALDANKEILKVQPDDIDAVFRDTHVHRWRGDLETADDARRRFLEFRDEMDRTGASEELGYLGVNKPRANLDVMEEVHLGSLRVAERMGRKENMARNYSYLGAIYLAKRELSKAEEMYGAALEIETKLRREGKIASLYGNLGAVYKERGERNKAREFWIKSRTSFEKIGNKEMAKKIQTALNEL